MYAAEHRIAADCHAGLHRDCVAGNPSRQQLNATLGVRALDSDTFYGTQQRRRRRLWLRVV